MSFFDNYCGEHKGNDGTEMSSLLPPQQSNDKLNVFWVKEKCNLWLKKEESWKFSEPVPVQGVDSCDVCTMQGYFA